MKENELAEHKSQVVSQNHQDTNGRQEINKATGDWLTAEEAAWYVRCSIKTIYNHKYNGTIKGYNSGGKLRGKLLFKRSDLDAFITGKKT